MLASVGIHAAALLLPDLEQAPAPEPLTLQAEIVLQPRQAPAPVAEKMIAPPKPPPSVRPVRKTPTKPLPKEPVMAMDKHPVAEEPQFVSGSAPQEVRAPSSVPSVMPASPVVTESPATSSPGLPAEGRIEYVVVSGDPPTILGSAEHHWLMSDGRYRILSVMETTGVAAWVKPVRLETESTGELVAGGLKPERYVSRRVLREKSEQIDFDWGAGVARLSRGGSVPLAAGAQDLLSFNYQLGWLARTGEMVVATTRKLGTSHLELLGKEWLDTPAGPIWTLHFRARGETTTEVWLAAEQYLLPVKIQHIDKKGERFAQIARQITLKEP